MRRPSHTPTSLQTHACRLISLHTDPTTLRHNHTPTFWRTASFTRRPSYTRTLLHTNSNTHTHTHAHTHTRTHTYTHTHGHTHRRFYTRFPRLWDPFYTQLHTPTFSHAIFTHKGFFTYAPPTHTHTHIDIIPEASSLQWQMIYIFSFSFLRNQISVKKLVSVYCQTQFRPMNFLSYVYVILMQKKNNISPKYSLTYAFLISTNYSRQNILSQPNLVPKYVIVSSPFELIPPFKGLASSHLSACCLVVIHQHCCQRVDLNTSLL